MIPFLVVYVSFVSFHDVGRLGCPCCGHDPNHKIKNGGNCECCNGLGKLTETQFNSKLMNMVLKMI